uniref:Gnk2-homologous domain-containing protein n=1 Tax=Chenopodium quinoa TaxID=63459 RepID=A0A803MIQ4_CHEQI
MKPTSKQQSTNSHQEYQPPTTASTPPASAKTELTPFFPVATTSPMKIAKIVLLVPQKMFQEETPQLYHHIPGLDEDFSFSQLLDNTVTDLIKDVTSEFAVSSRYFATTTAEYSSSKSIYALAQCNPDISTIECRLCLRTSYNDFMSNYSGINYGQIFTPSCRLSYILSSEEPSEPWKFLQTYDNEERYIPRYTPRLFTSTGMIIYVLSYKFITLVRMRDYTTFKS